jgi:hypothetical protein
MQLTWKELDDARQNRLAPYPHCLVCSVCWEGTRQEVGGGGATEGDFDSK